MRTVTYRLDDLKKTVIYIGKVAENEYTRIRIDAGDLYAEYPHAAVSLTVQPPDGEAYPAAVTRDGNMVIWDVPDSALNSEGDGELQLTFTAGDVKVKSEICGIRVCRSIVSEGEAPDPLEDFLAEAGAALTAIPEAIGAALEEAKESGEFDGPPGQDGKDGADGKDGKDGKDGADGQPGADGKDGADGYSPTATVTKSGKVATITITDKNGTTTETVSDGEDADPTTLIDDSSTAANKVWSAQKSNELKSALTFVKGEGDNSAVLDGEYYGYSNSAEGHFSTANGIGSVAYGLLSHAEGLRTKAIGQGSHSDGSESCAFGASSHTEGSSFAYGSTSHAEGGSGGKSLSLTGSANATTYNVTSGTAKDEDVGNYIVYKNLVREISSVDTVNNTVTLNSSFGEALSASPCRTYIGIAFGDYSHAEGYCTISKGFAGHAEGVFNVPGSYLPTWTANTSYSVGDRVRKNGSGYICIEANSDSSWTSSKWAFCWFFTNDILAVGNGYDNLHRSNAFSVDVYGNGRFNGDVYVGCNADGTGGAKLVADVQIAVSGSTPTINAVAGARYICGEVSTLTIVVPASGIIDVVFESGSTATVLTITPPTGQTVKWANFDPTSLEANTTYELNIMDCKGVAGSWT